jgi:CheY-like chemotaxis protein
VEKQNKEKTMSSNLLYPDFQSDATIHLNDHQPNMPIDHRLCSMRSVILVDSNSRAIVQLSNRLRAAGVRVVCVQTAASAMREYVQHPADILLVNVDLPDNSGWLFVAKLRLTHPNAFVVLCRTRELSGDARQAAHIGADGFLSLSEDDHGLAVRLASLFDEHRRRLLRIA